MLRKFVKSYIIENEKIYKLLSIIFLVGLALGIIYVNKYGISNSDFFENYSKNYLNFENKDFFNYFISKVIFKIILILIIFLLTCTVIFSKLNYLVIMYKGFSIGYIITGFLSIYGIKNGMVFSFQNFIFQILIYIPSLIIFTAVCIKFSKIIKMENVNLKSELIKLCIAMLINIVISILCGGMESAFFYKILKKVYKI